MKTKKDSHSAIWQYEKKSKVYFFKITYINYLCIERMQQTADLFLNGKRQIKNNR